MKRVFITLAICAGIARTATAQNETDALRYSFLQMQGTARSMGMGGAFGALGADLSSLSTNPAGIGLYRKSEFSFSPGISSATTKSRFLSETNEDFRSIFQFSSIGVISHYEDQKGLWKSMNFGVGYNKLASFQENVLIKGRNANTTLLDVFANQANGIAPDDIYDLVPFGAALAYDTYLINPTDSTGASYLTEIPFGELNQRVAMERKGSMGETVINGAANYNNKMYIGLSIGFPSVRYIENSNYMEFDLDPSLELDQFTLREELLTSGSGVNVKLGVIYRASEWLRVGAAVHSPSWLSLHDSYKTTMSSRFDNGDNYYFESPQGAYQYNLRTPPRYMANAAFILGKAGVISADYEYVDYSQARLRTSNQIPDDYDFAIENAAISTIYRGTHNVRVGAEARVAEVWRVRAGAGYQQSPFVPGTVVSNPAQFNYSSGVGYNNGRIYVDLAWSMWQREADYYLYDPQLVDVATMDRTRTSVVATVGVRY